MICTTLSCERKIQNRADLVVMTVLTNNIHCLDDVRVFEGTSYTKLRGDLLLILLLTLAIPLGTKLLDSKDGPAVFVRAFDETNCATCAGAKNSTPFSILLMDVGMSSVLK